MYILLVHRCALRAHVLLKKRVMRQFGKLCTRRTLFCLRAMAPTHAECVCIPAKIDKFE